jgi:ankyrin repeat protein
MSRIILSYLFKTHLAELRSAILEDNTDKICRILDIEHDYLNRPIDSNGNTALILATQHASPLTVRLLLEQGAQPDKLNGLTFHTPLGIIASTEYEDYYSHKAQQTLEMAKILLDYGAYVDKPSLRIYRDENNKDYYGKETPLMTAVRKQNLPLVTLLIARKANVNSIERRSKIRPYVSLTHLFNRSISILGFISLLPMAMK